MSTLRAVTRLTALRAPAPRTTAFFSTTHAARSGGHESHYDPPTGWLFGVKPGEKYEKEGWEGPIYWGLCGSMAFGVVAYAFKPDTRYVGFGGLKEKRKEEVSGLEKRLNGDASGRTRTDYSQHPDLGPRGGATKTRS
jgi:hypothetical protein